MSDIEVLSIGHSNLSYELFLSLLRNAGVTAIADVRSTPHSRHFPHFNQASLQPELKADGVAYVYLGEELGGRPKDSAYFLNGVANYERMINAPMFSIGVDRVITGASAYCIALMCSEHNPLDCHRCLLVGRALKGRGVNVRHILAGGRQLTQNQVEQHLLSAAKKGDDDMFASYNERLATAYRLRAQQVAFASDRFDHKPAAE